MRALRGLFVVHAMLTGAAGVVLLLAPGVIPHVVGIALPPDAYLLAYLLAGAELGFAALSLLAARSDSPAALRSAALACAVFHGASALGEVRALAAGVDTRVALNVAVRVIVMLAFLRLAPGATVTVARDDAI
jgi:hypothetical protein